MKNPNKWKFRYREIRKSNYSDHHYFLDMFCYRRPKTFNESKQFDKKYSRWKRSPSNIPSSWDDIDISDWRSKSWKDRTKRKHQWKIS